ncbi:hypothetical protein SLS57_003897 [Botryosphaeria dothidea]
MTAAAFAKELLSKVNIQEVRSADKAGEVVKHLQGTEARLTARFKLLEDTNFMNNVRIWLGPARVEKDFDVARELHCSGTNAWFLNHKSFRNWCNGHYPYLWIHGVSGCGKTVLSSQVIKELDEDCLYFFFDFRDIRKQTLNDVLRTLIHQLLLKRPETKSALRPFYSHFVHKMPSTGDLKRAFDDMMTAADSIPIIFDALDEAKLTEVDALLRWIIEMLINQTYERCYNQKWYQDTLSGLAAT